MKDNVEITRWTSTTNPHVISDLETGTYTIVEVSAPSGYIKASEQNILIVYSDKTATVVHTLPPDDDKVSDTILTTDATNQVAGEDLNLNHT